MALSDSQRARAEAAIRDFLKALGVYGEQLASTPRRVTAAFADELLAGYDVDFDSLIEQGSEPLPPGHSHPVLVENMRVVTVCPHHLLVARGKADVAYVPGPRMLGLGTLSRIVNACSRRLVLQEVIAPTVVDVLVERAGAQGAFCRLRFDHACMQARGPEQDAAQAVTWASAGTLKDPAQLELALGSSLREGASTSSSGDAS